MPNLLLMGGSRAGQTVNLESGNNVFRALVRVTVAGHHERSTHASGGVEEYHLETIYNGTRDVQVLVLNGVNPIDELLRGYHPIISDDY